MRIIIKFLDYINFDIYLFHFQKTNNSIKVALHCQGVSKKGNPTLACRCALITAWVYERNFGIVIKIRVSAVE